MRAFLLVLPILFAASAHAELVDRKDLDPGIISEAFDELDDLNGVEVLRLSCPEILGPADPTAAVEPVCIEMLTLPEGEVKMKNCIDAFRRVPNKDALRWTLEYFVKNQGGIKDASCFLDDESLDSLKVGSKEWRKAAKEKGVSTIRFGATRAREEWSRMAKNRGIELKELKHNIANRGIENGCQIMMNDFSSACGSSPKGPYGYWIDLCSDSGASVRELDVVKKGTGTCQNQFQDDPDKKTTIAGAFLSGEMSAHDPYKMTAGYKALKKKGILKKVVLFGLNESNNDSYWDKHVHTSPYMTSSGCPAVNGSDVDIIEEMGKSQTLVVNYGPKKFHESVDDCHNGDGGRE